MLVLQYFLSYLLAFLAFSAGIEARQLPFELPKCAEDCNLLMRCDPRALSERVFAIVDGKCRVFNNGCQFASTNCTRVARCLTALAPITKAECQLTCPTCGEGPDDPFSINIENISL